MKLWQKTLNNSPISNGSATCSRSAWSCRSRPCWRPRPTSTATSPPSISGSWAASAATSTTSWSPRSRIFAAFTQTVLGWEPADLLDVSPGRAGIEGLGSHAPDYNETLRPTWAVQRVGAQGPGPPLADAHPVRAPRRGLRRGRGQRTSGTGRPAPTPASSGCCGKRKCPSGCSPAPQTCGWCTPRGARPAAT